MPNSICFMVMPFGTKPVPGASGKQPSQIDFDALWEKALIPAIKGAGYDPVRADADVGALIIKDMLARLAWADVVVADLTLPNANVYYEVGVRHAARQKGCVLIAADWSRQMFDLEQMRSVRYPLPEGEIEDATADAIQQQVEASLESLADSPSPIWEEVSGYSAEVKGEPPASFQELVAKLSDFQTMVRAVRAAHPDLRADKALELQAKIQQGGGEILPSVALELLWLIRDTVDWQETLQYIDGLPARLKALPLVREQKALALSKSGDAALAIGGLEQLIEEQGDTPERSGLLGGRYKALYRAAADEVSRDDYLDKAIEAYERGAMLDLNTYYCSGNLAQLYRARDEDEDEEAARRAASRTLDACLRAHQLKQGDEWLYATMFGACVDTRDLSQAKALLRKVRSNPTAWKLKTSLEDFRQRIEQIPAGDTRKGFVSTLKKLEVVADQLSKD